LKYENFFVSSCVLYITALKKPNKKIGLKIDYGKKGEFIMKKLLMSLVIGALIATSLGCTKEDIPAQIDEENEISIENNPVEEVQDEEQVVNASYDLLEKVFENKEKNIVIHYPEMTGFRGELLQDYINQSLASILGIYGDSESYSDIDVMYEVTRMDDEMLSVVFRGTGKFSEQRDINILKSVNLDVAKSSNEINYSNLINDDAAMRQILAKKVVDLKLADFFEAEGIRIYFNDDQVVFYYMPLDDSAVDFIEVPVAVEEIKELLNVDFGEIPAS